MTNEQLTAAMVANEMCELERLAHPANTHTPTSGHLAPGGTLELVGRTEAAALLGVRPTNLTQLRNLPAPAVDYLKAGRLWLLSDIREFARDHRRV